MGPYWSWLLVSLDGWMVGDGQMDDLWVSVCSPVQQSLGRDLVVDRGQDQQLWCCVSRPTPSLFVLLRGSGPKTAVRDGVVREQETT